MRNSIKSTYDSRETGPAYHVTYQIGDRTLTFQEPIDDPFVRGIVRVSRWEMLKSLLRWRPLKVCMIVGGHLDRMYDVLELDDNTLIPGSSRRAAFDSHINERLGA